MSATRFARSLERYLLPIEAVTVGMYVTDIDRPWLDTPFVMEGFLVRTEREILALRQHTRLAYVDLQRSSESVAAAVRAAALDRKKAREPAQRGAAAARRSGPGQDGDAGGRTGEPTSLLGRMRRWFDRPAAPEASAEERLSQAALAAKLQIPPSQKLERYAAPRPIQAELPRAQSTFARGVDMLGALMRDLRGDARPSLRDVEEVADGLVESMIECPDAMLWVARMRSHNQRTYMHCLRVALHLIALGRQIGFPREDLVRLGLIGMLADVGKIRVPRALLDKPALLTPSEHDMVKLHVQLGLDALGKSMKLDDKVVQGILQHHERMDGTGYPAGLKGKEIGIFGRMTAIADCFAALTIDRPYAKAMSAQDAMLNLYKWSGGSFHEALVEQFVQAIGVFPVGGLVELSNGEIAVVLAHNQVRRLEPRVLVIAVGEGEMIGRPFERDLLTKPVDAEGRPIRIARGLPSGAWGLRPADYYAIDSGKQSADAVA
ncbi:HD-GYP domain-containing protein [Zeimonas arvi]|uniref:HD-GYP domain-containing protein n=1 Tax=Zeimonas arvi TaxID=2498847 RepID=A0A5C8NVU0_9BURK|nr:HD-GYP domain-containing protein [Zeimonas arvi]TXL65357.1 HD-GYP domain-containing protein [Zeimonas arvi]